MSAPFSGRVTGTIAALWRRVTLDGRLRLAQPWAPAIGGLALGLALIFPARWLLYLAYVYLLLTLGSYLWARAVGPRLRLQRHLRTEWAQVGDELEEGWELANDAPLPLLWLEIEDGSSLPDYNARRVVDAGAGERFSWRTTARCARRGRYRLGPLTARCADPAGLFRYEWRDEASRQLIVYPPLVRLPELAPPSGTRGGLARADLLQLFVTPNVGGLRAYVPGDPPGRVHWPYVARYGQLYVKEFDQERSGALWVVLDLARGAYPQTWPAEEHSDEGPPSGASQSSVVSGAMAEYRAASLVDLAVTLAGSLAARALAEGRQVGLLCDGGERRMVPPGGGQRQLWRILAALVDGEDAGEQTLGELLRSHAARGASELGGAAIAVVTGELGAAWLPDLVECTHGRPGGALALLVAERAERAATCAARLAAPGISA
ncbi:MAG: DUF58 domain-containing protein, partial [Chloroflexales bacterium]|nr:DUF58 domain-containing protein [Chloroflexales bacterium]